jgi:hypothetical protein
MTMRMLMAALLVTAFASANGCAWLQRRPAVEPTPILFHEVPTLEQLVTAVNANTDRVQTLQTRDAKLVLKGLPDVKLDMAYAQPRRFRLRAGTGFTGQELDLGNNDELFWFWARQNPEPALFYARHDQFAHSPNRALIPVEPSWVIDAMGLCRFDPNHRHEGPDVRGNGILEIRSRIPSPEGEVTKLTQLHAKYAWVMQQTMYDARGRLMASSQASEHEYYPFAQVALPRKVAISLPPAQLDFQVETGGYAINVALGDPGALFTLPQDQFPNYPLVDLADPRLQQQAAPASAPVAPPQAAYPTAQEAPRIRGLDSATR